MKRKIQVKKIFFFFFKLNKQINKKGTWDGVNLKKNKKF